MRGTLPPVDVVRSEHSIEERCRRGLRSKRLDGIHTASPTVQGIGPANLRMTGHDKDPLWKVNSYCSVLSPVPGVYLCLFPWAAAKLDRNVDGAFLHEPEKNILRSLLMRSENRTSNMSEGIGIPVPETHSHIPGNNYQGHQIKSNTQKRRTNHAWEPRGRRECG